MGFMPHSNIHVNTIYSRPALAIRAIWAQNEAMNRVKALRLKKGLSQVELAEKVGCSQGMISKIEKGLANPTLDLIEALARALDAEPPSLFTMPELHQRVLDAIQRISPEYRESALVVLEKMAEN